MTWSVQVEGGAPPATEQSLTSRKLRGDDELEELLDWSDSSQHFEGNTSRPHLRSHTLHSPASSTHSSVIDLHSEAAVSDSDSDFEFIDSTSDVAPGDGWDVGASRSAPNRALSGASTMDAGSSNDYGDSDWQQAGHNADAQDLAGPGAHGSLECKVDKPQKEGEGTQNPYISYLVTTDVSVAMHTASMIKPADALD